MKTSFFTVLLFVSLTLILNSCDFVGNIFEAGVWVGIVIVILVVVGIIWLIRKMFD